MTALAPALLSALRRAAGSRHGALTVRAFACAVEINRTPDPVSQSELRALLRMTDAQASRAIGMAVRAGLARREQRQDGGDRRLVHLHPTPDGRQLVTLLAREPTP